MAEDPTKKLLKVMQKFVLINRKLVAQAQAKISIDQRACLFGDGIFETCRISNGVIYNFTAHRSRINEGLQALKFSAAIENLEKDAYKLIKKNQIKNGILRISISRGTGSLGYLPTYKTSALVIIQTSLSRKIAAKKITLAVSSIKKPPQNSLPVSCKTMQALPYTLNKIESQEKKVFDCVMMSQRDFISETSSANIFWVKDGEIFTASESCDVLLGTIRQKLLLSKKFKVKKVEAKISKLEKADEIFLTNVSFLALAVDELQLGKKVVKFKKEVSLEVLKWLKDDIESINQ